MLSGACAWSVAVWLPWQSLVGFGAMLDVPGPDATTLRHRWLMKAATASLLPALWLLSRRAIRQARWRWRTVALGVLLLLAGRFGFGLRAWLAGCGVVFAGALALPVGRGVDGPRWLAPAIALWALPVTLLPWTVGLWWLTPLAAGWTLGWLMWRGRRALAVWTIVAAVAVGLGWQGRWHADRQWYGFHVCLDALQFGDIDGDGRVDLLTYGHRGMAAGNPCWFAGRRGGFHDWHSGGHELGGPGWLLLADLDGDGDLDVLAESGVRVNDGAGRFGHVAMSFAASPRAHGATGTGTGLYAAHERSDVHVVELTGDRWPELVALRPRGSVVVNIGLEPLRWRTEWLTDWRADGGIALERGPRGQRLVIPRGHAQARGRAVALGLRHRVLTASLPYGEGPRRSLPQQGRFRRWLWRDLDGDGVTELVRWDEQPETDGVVTEIRVYREGAEGFGELACIRTEARDRISWQTPPPARSKWVDVDRDGRLDFTGDDGWIYRQQPGWRFERAARVTLPDRHGDSRLYVADVDGDGWPDVVSSFQPFWNIRLGPLLR